jgi:hypothetical protein
MQVYMYIDLLLEIGLHSWFSVLSCLASLSPHRRPIVLFGSFYSKPNHLLWDPQLRARLERLLLAGHYPEGLGRAHLHP